MLKKYFTFLCLSACYYLLCASTIADIQNSYEEGALHSNHYLLRISPSDAKDLVSCKLFFTAKTAKTTDNAIQFYKRASQNESSCIYSQKAFLELAKLDFFNRDYISALDKLSKINLIDEKYYWQTRIYHIQKKLSIAAISANSYLSNKTDEPMAFEINCILFDIYLQQLKINEFSALKTKIKQYSNYRYYEAYILYKEALLYDKTNNYNYAIDTLKSIIARFPKSQYRVMADDLLIELNKKIVPQNKPAEPNITISQPDAPKVNKNSLLDLSDLKKNKAYLQYGIFSTQKAGETYKTQLEAQGLKPFMITKFVNNKQHFAIIQGPFDSKNEANKFLNQINSNNINGFIFIP